jgi:hypothetical protein
MAEAFEARLPVDFLEDLNAELLICKRVLEEGLSASTVLGLPEDYSTMSESDYMSQLLSSRYGAEGMIVTEQKQAVLPLILPQSLIATAASQCRQEIPLQGFFRTLLDLIDRAAIQEAMLSHGLVKIEDIHDWIADPVHSVVLHALRSLAVPICPRPGLI